MSTAQAFFGGREVYLRNERNREIKRPSLSLQQQSHEVKQARNAKQAVQMVASIAYSSRKALGKSYRAGPASKIYNLSPRTSRKDESKAS
jgi:hypothetical protein